MAALGTLLSAVASFVIGGVSRALGPRFGLVDEPDQDDLKIHTTRAVPLGGLGILIGLHLGLLIADSLDPGLLVGSMLIWLVGLVDDVRGLEPVTRLIATSVAGGALVWFGSLTTGWWEALFAVLVVVVTVNAVNLLDGLDALAGSVTSAGLIGLAILGATRGSPWALGVLISAMAVIGFLYWNLPPARLFLGNNGAYLIGLVLAWAALAISDGWSAQMVAVAAIGVPFLDLAITVVRRLRTGAPLFGGDRDHSYDRLHRRGWSLSKIAALFVCIQILWAAVVVITAGTAGDVAAIVVASIVGLGTVAVFGLDRSSIAPSR